MGAEHGFFVSENDGIGGVSAVHEARMSPEHAKALLRVEVAEKGAFGLLDMSIHGGNNAINNLIRHIEWGRIPADASYSFTDCRPDLMDGLDTMYERNISAARSLDEARAMKDFYLHKEHVEAVLDSAGFAGVQARYMAGGFDLMLGLIVVGLIAKRVKSYRVAVKWMLGILVPLTAFEAGLGYPGWFLMMPAVLLVGLAVAAVLFFDAKQKRSTLEPTV